MSGIGVVGAGAFGTALAISLANSNRQVTLWARDQSRATEMQKTRENARYLPGAKLPDPLRITGDFSTVSSQGILLLAVPMQRLRALVGSHLSELDRKTLVSCCKGVELGTQLGPVALLQELVPQSVPAILTGPSFAQDIALGLPTALTLAVPTRRGERPCRMP